MLWRFRDLFDGGQDLLRAEAQLAVRKMRRSLAAVLLLAAASGVALIGLLTLLAGVGVALAREWGWIWSLSAIGGVLLLVGLIASAVVAARLRAIGEPETGPGPKERARQSKEQMSDAVDPTVSKEEAHPEAAGRNRRAGGDAARDCENPLEDLKSAAIEFATKNPMAVAGAAFAAVSLVGPGRAVRMVSRGLTVASIAASVLGKLGEDDGAEETRRPSSGAAPGAGGPTPPGPRPGGSGHNSGHNGHHQHPGVPRPRATGGAPGPSAGEPRVDDAHAVPTRDAPPGRFRVTGT